MQELGLTGLEITTGSDKLRLERSVSPPAAPQAAPAAQTASAAAPRPVDEIAVTSPIVGVFYAAPAENAEPYVSIGDRVEKGKVLCIIEAMKLMNEIVAEESGVITDICVTNGQVVEYGTVLFRVRR